MSSDNKPSGAAPPLSKEVLRRATPWHERLSGNAESPPHDSSSDRAAASERLIIWQQRLGGVTRLLSKRLEAQGVSSAAAMRAVAPQASCSDVAWAPIYQMAMDAAATAPTGVVNLPPTVPFIEVLAPFVNTAQRLAADATPAWNTMNSGSRRGLNQALIDRLNRLTESVLGAEFIASNGDAKSQDTLGEQTAPGSRHLYSAFVQHLLDQELCGIAQAYPVLARRLATGIRNWSLATADFLNHLVADRQVIEGWARRHGFEGRCGIADIVEIKDDLSDPHRGGRTVKVVEFADGYSVVYKPRSIAIDLTFYTFIGWINERSNGLDLRVPSFIDCGDHGWMETLHSTDCRGESEVRQFYYRAGALLFLAWMLRGGDLTADNVFAAGESPVLIDLETLFLPDLAWSAQPAREVDRYDVRSTLFLPYEALLGNGLREPMGGVTLDRDVRESQTAFVWQHVNTDGMQPVKVQLEAGSRPNQPTLGGDKVGVDRWRADFRRGFSELGETLLAVRSRTSGPPPFLKPFAGLATRWIFRPTALYGSVIDRATAAERMTDGGVHGLTWESLSRAVIDLGSDSQLWELYCDEVRQLEAGDIPAFATRTDSRDLFLSSGRHLPNFFARSGMEAAHGLWQELDRSVIDHQLSLISDVLAPSRG